MSKSDLQIVQEQWLLHCLHKNKKSRFGKRYNFSDIRCIKDYQQQVPLNHYNDLKPWIDALSQGENSILFDEPVIAFEVTSGSTHARKLIPYSESSLLDFQKAILPWLKLISEQYKLQSGFAYWALSPATRKQEFTDSGIAIGLPDERYLGENISSFFTLQTAVPHWVGNIEEVHKWQLYTLYWLICKKELAFVSVWSPTFFIVLIEAIDRHYSNLSALLLKGGQYNQHCLPADKEAYQRLLQYRNSKDSKILWPKLKLVSCWADASSKSYYAQLKKIFYYAAFQAKGLLLTEGVVTIPDKDGQTVLAGQSVFFEFLINDKIVLAHELTINSCYDVIITTSGGLYRYCTQDRVVCEGHRDGWPILRFIGRNGIQSDLVGEKLTEEFVTSCLSVIEDFSLLLPCRGKKPYYCLLLEKNVYTDYSDIAEILDQQLSKNSQYAYARKMGQLGKITVHTMEQPLDKYLQVMINDGMRMGDIKIPALSLDDTLLKKMGEL
ncbi:MAG: GH3 auxin-responsive promoter family protein [Gammaproteobacteria bacterium]|nr:GH3 auxin-responsive promoter family protein [Gammaproteobacteria bacterium]